MLLKHHRTLGKAGIGVAQILRTLLFRDQVCLEHRPCLNIFRSVTRQLLEIFIRRYDPHGFIQHVPAVWDRMNMVTGFRTVVGGFCVFYMLVPALFGRISAYKLIRRIFLQHLEKLRHDKGVELAARTPP